MSRGISVVWWTGLVGALLATLAVLKQVTLVVGTLRDILRLSERTRIAAEGTAANVAVIPRLAEAAPPAAELREAAAALARSAGSIERKLAALPFPSAVKGG